MKGNCSIRSQGRQPRGVTLLEIVISMMLLTLLAITVISSVIFTSRGARLNTNAIAAKNIAQGYFERMAGDEFSNVGPPADGAVFWPNLPDPNDANGRIAGTGYPDIAIDDPDPVWIDQAMQIPCAVSFDFKGFGIATGGGATSLTDNDAAWETNEWAGDTLYLVDGAGAGQFAQIASNTATVLTLASAFTVDPDATTKYMINNGKTIEITTTWFYQGEPFTQTIESLIINYQNSAFLGFEGEQT
jgi:type II secretory pathway pseudopilin PulG